MNTSSKVDKILIVSGSTPSTMIDLYKGMGYQIEEIGLIPKVTGRQPTCLLVDEAYDLKEPIDKWAEADYSQLEERTIGYDYGTDDLSVIVEGRFINDDVYVITGIRELPPSLYYRGSNFSRHRSCDIQGLDIAIKAEDDRPRTMTGYDWRQGRQHIKNTRRRK